MHFMPSVLIGALPAYELKTAARVVGDPPPFLANARCSVVRLRRRALRLNDHGEEVVRLQQALQELGYDVGDVNGEFGYLTRDALCQFQREHHLTVDGRAGAEVFAVLFRPELRAMRQTYVVRAGESLIDVARAQGVTVEYLKRSNRITKRRPIYEGRRLYIRSRYVIGAVDSLGGREARYLLGRHGRHLSALGAATFRLDAEGEVEGEWEAESLEACGDEGVHALSVIHTWDSVGQTDRTLRAILRSRTRRAKAAAACRKLGLHDGVAGVVLDFGGLQVGDGSRLVRWIEELASAIRPKGRRLYLSVPVPHTGVRGLIRMADIDWARLERAVDGLILQSHRPTPWRSGVLTTGQLRGRLKALCKYVPYWKVLLGVHLGARETTEAGVHTRDVTYQRAVSMAYLQGNRPAWDGARGSLVAPYTPPEPESERRLLFIHNAQSVRERLQLVERYNLHGVFLWPLGGEDARLWQEFPHWIKAWRHEAPAVHI